MLDLINLQPEEPPPRAPRESSGLLDALDLAVSPVNLLAVGWTLARGEFDGLRVDAPVRMAWL